MFTEVNSIDGDIIISIKPDPDIIACLITFENSHLVAQALKDVHPTAARALYNELAYWAEHNQI